MDDTVFIQDAVATPMLLQPQISVSPGVGFGPEIDIDFPGELISPRV